jgi:hypothetical protein
MMKKNVYKILIVSIFCFTTGLTFSQNIENCFLNDFEGKTASIPPSINAEKPPGTATVTVSIQGDTLGKISKYIFGNAIAAWAGAHNNPTIVENTQLLEPTLIRFPGGSWADIYFWNGLPSDIPDSLYDGTKYNGTTAPKDKLWAQSGKGSWPTTPDQWYNLRDAVGTEGLITINYGYARYGLSDDPVAQAAHLAAEWVRYDDGRTKFWEIGNENSGPWEAGWMIDTALNKDGQPQIITGELYGKHFNVFADSMRKAAAEIDAEIYIGAIVIHFPPSEAWNEPDKKWNEGLFKEIGNSADFYVMHNYFGSQTNIKGILNWAVSETKKNIDFIRQDIANKNAFPKPVALTEYNIGSGTTERTNSYVNGMQAVVLFNELIKNNFGLSARWLLITGETGMYYDGSDANYKYHPHPEFYYCTFAQKFCGDHSIAASSSSQDILSYATRFSSGETGVVIVNKNTTEQVISINSAGVGNNYYIYSFTGGTDNAPFSQNVYINGNGPDEYQWGPYNDLLSIPANKYTIENEIKFTSPGNSVQFILLERGNNVVTSVDEKTPAAINEFTLHQNYPNPFNPSTKISFSIKKTGLVKLNVYNLLGQHVATMVKEKLNAGVYERTFNASNLPSGLYLYKLVVDSFGEAGKNFLVNKMMLLK